MRAQGSPLPQKSGPSPEPPTTWNRGLGMRLERDVADVRPRLKRGSVSCPRQMISGCHGLDLTPDTPPRDRDHEPRRVPIATHRKYSSKRQCWEVVMRLELPHPARICLSARFAGSATRDQRRRRNSHRCGSGRHRSHTTWTWPESRRLRLRECRAEVDGSTAERFCCGRASSQESSRRSLKASRRMASGEPFVGTQIEFDTASMLETCPE